MTKQNRIWRMAILLVALAGGWARAQSRFDGSAGTGWNNTDNWTPAGIPTLTTPVIIGTTNAAVGAGGSPMTAVIGPGDTCEAASVTLGELPFNSGTLDMSGGTLTLPAAGSITVAGAASSVGTLNQTGGTLSGITSGTLTIGSGANSVGSITLGNDSSITSAVDIASASGASGTFTLTNSARWQNTSTDKNIGSAAGAVGSLNVYGNGYVDLGTRGLNFGTAWGSTGLLRVADSGVITNSAYYLRIGNPGYGDAVVSGTGKVYVTAVELCSTGGVPSSLTVRDSGYVKGLNLIGGGSAPTTGGQDGIATVTLSDNATVDPYAGQWTVVGAAARSTGRLYVRDNAVFRLLGSSLSIGGGTVSGIAQPNNRTGVVEVAGYGVITNANNIYIGWNGSAEMTVSGTGKVYATAVELNSTGGVACALTVRDSGYVGGLYKIGNSDNIATVTLSNNATATGWSGQKTSVGFATRSTGRLYVRDNAVFGFASATPVYIGEGVNSTGIVEVSGNAVFTNCSALSIAYGAGSVGRLDLLGGKLHQAGATTVGGGTAGDRYGLVTISNATFGGSTAATVWTNGFVELTGTGSVFQCGTFTCRGGSLTNHVRAMSGGLDITGSAGTALVVTNGGRVHLSFEKHPPVATNLWGLRWMGNNHSNDLQQLLDAGALTWSKSVTADVKIYTNATHTWIGYQAPAESPAGSVVMVY